MKELTINHISCLLCKSKLKIFWVAYLEKRRELAAPSWGGSSAFSPTTITTAQLAPHAEKRANRIVICSV